MCLTPTLQQSDRTAFVKINHNDGHAPTSLEFNYSHRPRQSTQIEIKGEEEYVERVCINLGAQFAAAEHYEKRFSELLDESQKDVKKELKDELETARKEIRVLQFTIDKLLEEREETRARLKALEDVLSRQPQQSKEGSKNGYDSYV